MPAPHAPRPTAEVPYVHLQFEARQRRYAEGFTHDLARSAHFLWPDRAQAQDYHALGAKWGLPFTGEEYADPNADFGRRPAK